MVRVPWMKQFQFHEVVHRRRPVGTFQAGCFQSCEGFLLFSVHGLRPEQVYRQVEPSHSSSSRLVHTKEGVLVRRTSDPVVPAILQAGCQRRHFGPTPDDRAQFRSRLRGRWPGIPETCVRHFVLQPGQAFPDCLVAQDVAPRVNQHPGRRHYEPVSPGHINGG